MLAVKDTQTKEPLTSLKKGITTFEERPHRIGINAIKSMIARTTCNPKLSTIFAKFIASSCILCEAPSTFASTALQYGMYEKVIASLHLKAQSLVK